MSSSLSTHRVLVYCFASPCCSGQVPCRFQSNHSLCYGGFCLHIHSLAGELGAYHLLGVFRRLTETQMGASGVSTMQMRFI